MLPFDSRDIAMRRRSSSTSTPFTSKLPDYIRRLCDVEQMDMDFAFNQMTTILSLSPQNVYTSFYYRKQTKNQWARDDPAFAVIEAAFVAIAALAYAVLFCPFSFWPYLWTVLYAVVVDWLFVGILVATFCSTISNKYLRQYNSHSVEQQVEWLYAFDVHCNAFLCSFMLTYIFQYFALPLLMNKAVLSCVLANTLYVSAAVWYAYITHLGYRGNTQIFLWYPVLFAVMVWLLTAVLLILGLRFNLTRISMHLHFGG